MVLCIGGPLHGQRVNSTLLHLSVRLPDGWREPKKEYLRELCELLSQFDEMVLRYEFLRVAVDPYEPATMQPFNVGTYSLRRFVRAGAMFEVYVFDGISDERATELLNSL